MIVVVEVGNTTEVDDILLSDGSHTSVSKADVPELHTVETFSGALVKAFKITSNNYFIDGTADTYVLSLTPESGWQIGEDDGMNVSITMYTMQEFVDIDGTLQYGIENSDGTLQYEDTFNFQYCITDTSS